MDNIITLNDGSQEVRFEFLDLIEYGGNEYVVLLPVDDPAEIGEVVILMLEGSDEGSDEETYVEVTDEGTLQEVFHIFKSRSKEAFDFVDEDDL